MAHLLQALRGATDALHRQLHRHPRLMACVEQRLCEHDYRLLLRAFYGPWLVLIPGLAQLPLADLHTCLLRRAQALAQDLAQLEVDCQTLQAPSELARWNHHDDSTARASALVGMSYVLAGSSLGAQQLVQQLTAALPQAPRRYLSLSPRASGWPPLASYLGTQQEKDHPAACRAAQQVFSAILVALD